MKPPSDQIPQPESISAQVDEFIRLIDKLEDAAYQRGIEEGDKQGFVRGYNYGYKVGGNAEPTTRPDD